MRQEKKITEKNRVSTYVNTYHIPAGDIDVVIFQAGKHRTYKIMMFNLSNAATRTVRFEDVYITRRGIKSYFHYRWEHSPADYGVNYTGPLYLADGDSLHCKCNGRGTRAEIKVSCNYVEYTPLN